MGDNFRFSLSEYCLSHNVKTQKWKTNSPRRQPLMQHFMLENKIHSPTRSDDNVCNKTFQWLLHRLQHLCSISLCETSSVCSSRWHRSSAEGQAKNLVHYWLTCSCVATCCPSIQRRKTWLQKMYSCQHKQETKPLNFACILHRCTHLWSEVFCWLDPLWSSRLEALDLNMCLHILKWLE